MSQTIRPTFIIRPFHLISNPLHLIRPIRRNPPRQYPLMIIPLQLLHFSPAFYPSSLNQQFTLPLLPLQSTFSSTWQFCS